MKNVVLADRNARLPFLSDTIEGALHEKPLVDLTPYPLPPDSELLQDLGFLGFTLPNVTITMPLGTAQGSLTHS